MDNPKKVSPEQNTNNDKDSPTVAPKTAASGYEIGLHFFVCVIVGTAIGYWLDDWLGTSPWMILLFIFLGFGAGFQAIWRYIK